MEAAYEKYHERGLVIIGINVSEEDEEPARAFVERYKLTFPVGYDISDKISSLYVVRATPTMIFIDQSGSMEDWHIGELSEKELQHRIGDLLK